MNLPPDQAVGVVGLGYVGLPLAIEFGKRRRTLGVDLCAEKIAHYRQGFDPSGEVEAADFQAASQLAFTTDSAALASATVIIVAVPTPVDAARRPDFSPLIAASTSVGKILRPGMTVVFESTVYPGATEEVCVPILERESGLSWRRDFHVGYSPERVNPGDKRRRLPDVVKVVAGDDAPTRDFLAALYGEIIRAGVHPASSIQVAEAAKVIENTQRDLNIALMNELAIIFNRLGIDTHEVLEAAGTKWNFIPFKPGLVGGHCIGVDPYYLTHKAEQIGYHPQVILAGRRINDGMAEYIAQSTVRLLLRQGGLQAGDAVIVLGLTFKEDCPDLRNSKAAELVTCLENYGLRVAVHDPLADPEAAREEYGITLSNWDDLPRNACAVVAAVSHRQYLTRPLAELLTRLKPGGVFSDVKAAFDADAIRAAGFALWRL